MQEHAITSAGHRYVLKEPFFVMATQNPIEQEGTYPLPEAQLDRFFYKLTVDYSNKDELKTILDRTTTGYKPDIKPVMTGQEIMGSQNLVKRVVMAPHVQDYAIRLVMASHPEGPYAVQATNKYVRWGASPRAAQAVTPRREIAGLARRPIQRQLLRRAKGVSAGHAPPSPVELRGRSRRHQHRRTCSRRSSPRRQPWPRRRRENLRMIIYFDESYDNNRHYLLYGALVRAGGFGGCTVGSWVFAVSRM